MQIQFGDHPSEECLERYLLHQSNSTELERVETHILACSDCVTRLEQAELYVATMKSACSNLPRNSYQVTWFSQFVDSLKAFLTPGRISWTAGLAILLAALIVAPAQFALRTPVSSANVSLAAWRGAESVYVPAKRPLNVTLSSIDLPDGSVGVQLVDAAGQEISHGGASISRESARVVLPPLQPATYFLRLFSTSDTKSGQRDLLREFAFVAR